MTKDEVKYICPKCKAVYTSKQKLEFCVCGGKLEADWEQSLKNIDAIFGKNIFGDMFGW